ncbi:MAG TPA: MmcQ/YjbR family DNA-binding protein [Clostridia bacterium]|nr:MmcQ/YjbR family DNA-binding protein [Clostridia bacterium]
MTRAELEQFILDNYGVKLDFPWVGFPEYGVFRHGGNRKWFALVMEITRDKLGLKDAEKINVVNFKCDPVLNGSLRNLPGIFPAYHMNKENWITVALDGSASDDVIKMLLEMSYNDTMPRPRGKKRA